MKNFITLALFIIISISSFAQDKIIKVSGDTINCKVTELAADQVKYYYKDNPKLVFGIENALVEKIFFETGEVVEIKNNNFNNPEYYANQNKHDLKINFLSPLFGSVEIAYEQSIKPGRTWETALGIIGAGIDQYEVSPIGAFGKFTYKFMRKPDFYMNTMHYAHILKGAYFAPEFAFRVFGYDSYDYYYYYYNTGSSKERETDVSFAILLKLGKQWVFDDAFILDIYGGIGYGVSNNDNGFTYGFISGPKEFPMSGNVGIKIGWGF